MGCEARRHVRVYLVRMLYDFVSFILVESRVLPWTCCAHAGLSLDRGLPRPVHRGAIGLGERHHEVVPLPWDHELHQLLPEGPGPCQGHRAPQGSGRRDIHRRLEGHHGQADRLERWARIRHDVYVREGGMRWSSGEWHVTPQRATTFDLCTSFCKQRWNWKVLSGPQFVDQCA